DRGIRHHPTQVVCQHIRRNHILSNHIRIRIPQPQAQRQFAPPGTAGLRFVWFIWFLWFIWLVLFNQINETNQTNQSNLPSFARRAPLRLWWWISTHAGGYRPLLNAHFTSRLLFAGNSELFLYEHAGTRIALQVG